MTSNMRKILLTTIVFVGFGVTVASQTLAARMNSFPEMSAASGTEAAFNSAAHLDRVVGSLSMGNGRPSLMRQEGNACGPDGCLGGMP